MHADWQGLISAVVVAASGGYVLWHLMPAAWQGQLGNWFGRPLPTAAGCAGGCAGCASARPGSTVQPAPGTAPATKGVSVIQIVRRPPGR